MATLDEAGLGRILTLVTSRPNARRRPRLGDVRGEYQEWFDGGAVRVEDGATVYQLGDGTRVVRAGGSRLDLVIELRDGTRFRVQQE